MSFGNPWGLLALAAVVPLVAAYFLRRRQKPVVVSALFLWRTPRDRAEAGPRFERFTRELSLLLELLAVLAAALYLADVRFPWEQAHRRHVVLVVDGSLSLSARGPEGLSVLERTRTEVARRVGSERATHVTLLASGAAPRMLAGPEAPPSRALAALEAFQARGADHEPGPTLQWAQELAGPERPVHFFTDSLPAEGTALPPTVRWTALGAPRDNVALVSAWRKDEGSTATVSLRLTRFGSGPDSVEVRVVARPGPGAQSGTERREQVQLPAEGVATLRLTFENAGEVEVSLPEDALPEDGRALLAPAPERPVRVALAEGLSEPARQALERFLSVAPGVERGGEGALLFGPPGTDAPVTVGASGELRTYVGPFFSEKGHPLLEDVQLGGVRWSAGDNPPGRPLISADRAVLLAEEEGRLHLNVDLARSNVQRTPAWPVLLSNMLRAARQGQEGFVRRQLLLGEPLQVVTRAGARYALAGPEGRRTLVGAGLLELAPPPGPGRYTLEREGEPVDTVEVLGLDARESDLRTRSSGERKATAGSEEPPGSGPPRARWPLVVLLGAMLANFSLTRRMEVK